MLCCHLLFLFLGQKEMLAFALMQGWTPLHCAVPACSCDAASESADEAVS